MKWLRRLTLAWLIGAIAGLTAASHTWADEPRSPDGLRFMRVHVPRDGLADVPLGDARYVPMPRDAFEAAVARVTDVSGTASRPEELRAEAARYEARITAAGVLEGRVAFDLGPVAGGDATSTLPLGKLSVAACTATTAAGVGAVTVFGTGDGMSAVATAGAGEYVAEWTSGPPRATSDGRLYTLHLLPAVRSSIRLQLPPGQRPLLAGHDLPPTRVGGAWLIEAGARPRIEFSVIDERAAEPAISTWSRIEIMGREVAVELSVRPVAVWADERVAFDKDPALVVVSVALASGDRRAVAWSEAADKRSIMCLVPAVALGTRTPLVVRAVGPLPDGLVRPLPTLRPAVSSWAGGGSIVEVDPAWTLAALELEQCLAITAEAAAAWPLPPQADEQGDTAGGQIVPARVYLEHQGPGAAVRVAVVPRTARIDVQRVTVVDFAPGVVVGVATCDVGVRRGEAFDLTGLIAPGWFIDTVDAVGWASAAFGDDPGALQEARAAEPLEWKVVRDARGDVLRIGLTAAAVPGRRLRLRITGHRAGAAAGAAFSASEIDMVRLVGDTEGVAAIGFKTSAEQAVEISGADIGAVDPRLASLVDEPAVRAWAAVGGRSSSWQVKLVRRRPPLDVQAQVRLTVRDERLSQSFTFECRPDASALDSLVVQFSEPMDDLLEWSLLAPASGSMVARRLEAVDDSWVVEFTPPVREAVTIRAARTVPFEMPLPIPLAWVEGAPRQVGEVIVRDAGRRRPTIDNRRLAELPPRPGAAGDWPTLIGEFSFGGDRPPAGPAAAELVPGRRDDGAARAWAWRETTSCWCHASGRTEFETVFDIESHGRASVVIGLPAGRRLEGVEIDGATIAVVADENVTAIPIELPAGRPSFTLVVRSTAATTAWGAWRVEPAGVAIDLPVLDRMCRVAVPPELEIVSVSSAWRSVGWMARGVTERLAGVRGRSSVPSFAGSSGEQRGPSGEVFRVREFVPGDGRGDAGAVVIMPRRWIHGAAVLVGCIVGGVVLAGSRRGAWLAPVTCVIAGVAALWCPAPGDIVARAAWWAAIGAAMLVIRRPVARGALLTLVCLASPAPRASAADALPVFIAPLDDGEMAFVPEPLYRLLARTGGDTTGAIRVVGCQILVPATRAADPTSERWRLRIDIDALAAGVLELQPQDAVDGWIAETAQIDGEITPLTGAPVRHDLLVSTAGRHRIEIDVRPRIEQVGDVEVLTARLPPAPTATVEFAATAGIVPTGLWCEAATPGGPFVSAPSVWSAASERFVCSVPQAERVRIVRPQADGIALAAAPPVVESRNTVSWDLDACRVAASFVIDSGRDVAAPCIVRADRGLALVEPADAALDVVPLPGNRYLVRAVRPTAGPWRFEMTFRRLLASPVGIFAVPGVWIERAAADTRTTTLVPAGDLAVQVDAAAPFVMLAPDERGGPTWRADLRLQDGRARDGADEAGSTPFFNAEPRARVSVERRRQEIRGTQDARVRFTAERTFIELDARFDASSTPLVSLPLELPADCVVDSIALFDNGLQPPDPADRGPLDTSWRRATPERGVLTIQRPVAGRFRLELAAHMPHAPAATGRVPLVRALLPAAPAVVAWNESRDAPAPDRSWELRSDDRPPLYALRVALAPEPAEPLPAEPVSPMPQAVVADPRVELADVEVTFEDRGRAWGRARFDVVTQERVVRLALPRGMRLFEAFVDGQPALPFTPAAGSAPAPADGGERWDITLYDTTWPRSIEVVYAGTVGGALGEDGPIAVAAPTLVGLPCTRRIWTLRAPRDAVVHVAEPGRLLAAAAVQGEQAAALAALRTDFERVIETSPAIMRERLRAVLDAREQRLDEASRAGNDSTGAVVHVAAPIDAPLTVRIARRRDPSLTSRAWATLALLAVGGTAWIITRRR